MYVCLYAFTPAYVCIYLYIKVYIHIALPDRTGGTNATGMYVRMYVYTFVTNVYTGWEQVGKKNVL
jgi:hypothetical protein